MCFSCFPSQARKAMCSAMSQEAEVNADACDAMVRRRGPADAEPAHDGPPPMLDATSRRCSAPSSVWREISDAEEEEAQPRTKDIGKALTGELIPSVQRIRGAVAVTQGLKRWMRAFSGTSNDSSAIERAATDGHDLLSEPSFWLNKARQPVLAEIAFDSGTTQYCVVSHEAKARKLYELVILPEWGLQTPNLILSIMGGAGNMQTDSSRFDIESFSKGLVEAALRTGAWVITGGTKSGVMDIVGKAMKQHDKRRQVPCLGISPLGGLTPQWRRVLRSKGLKVDAADAKPGDGEPPETDNGIPLTEIQENHTHAIVIDSGKVGGKAFGTETKFRAEFEYFVASALHRERAPAAKELRRSSLANLDDLSPAAMASEVPRVMILVNGGKISLIQLLEAMNHGCPIVVCSGSGRLSDVISALLEEQETEDFDARLDKARADHMPKDPAFAPEERAMAREIVSSGAVEVYTVKERLEDVILRAVLGKSTKTRHCNVSVGHQLLLAVQWGCTDYFDLLVPRLVSGCGKEGPGKAIELIFKELVATRSGSQAKDKQIESKSQRVLVAWLLKNHRKQMEEFEVKESSLGRIHWNHTAVSRDGSWRSLEGLLLWSIEQEAPAAVLEVLWMYMEEPVHAALVAASACRETASKRHAYHSYHDGLASKSLNDTADRFERLAVLLLEDLAKSGKGVEYLFQESTRCWELGGHGCTCFRLAHQLGCRKFVAATFYSLAVDLYWMTPVPFSIKKRQLDARFLNWSNLHSLLLKPSESGFSLWELLSVPYIKAWTHGVSRLVFISIYSYAVFNGRLTQPGVQPVEAVLLLWGCGLAQVEVGQFWQMNSFSEYICDPWNFLDFVHISLMMVALVVGFFVSDSGPGMSNGKQSLEVTHALNLLPSWIRVLQLLQLSRYEGTLLMTVCGMVKDALRFFMLVSIFCFGFSCALTPILFAHGREREEQGLVWAFWTIVGVSKDMDIAREKADDQQRSMAMRYITQSLLYTLALVSNVLLVNLLIAVMNSTYDKNQAASVTDWAFYRVNAVLEFEGEQNLPPPLNLLERFMVSDRCDNHEACAPCLTRSKTLDLPITKRDLKDSQQRAMDAVGLEEDFGETAGLRAENAELRRKNAELMDRNRELERLSANFLLEGDLARSRAVTARE